MSYNGTLKVSKIIQTLWLRNNPQDDLKIMYDFDLSRIDKKIENARPQIFSFDYPMYGDATDKTRLETKILSHYYNYNINCNSVQQWQMHLKNTLNEIMPRYIQLWAKQEELINADITNPYTMEDIIKESKKRTIEGTATDNSNSSTTGNTTSNTTTDTNGTTGVKTMPQTVMQADNNYYSNITNNDLDEEVNTSGNSTMTSENDSTSTSNSSQDDSRDYTKTTKGNIGNYTITKLIQEYQNAIMNIELDIIKDLEPCFFGDMMSQL